jgi:hypothetical protein
MGEAIPRKVDEVGDNLLLAWLAHIEPPLPGQGGHPHEHLRVHRCQARGYAVCLELCREQMLDLTGDVEPYRQRDVVATTASVSPA